MPRPRGPATTESFRSWFLVTHGDQFNLRFNFLRFRPDPNMSGLILRLGLPMAIQYSAVQVSFLFVARMINAQGFVKLSFTVGILDAVVGRIFFCWFLGSFCGLEAFGYFLGYVIGTYVTAIVAAFYYFSGLWRKRAALV